MSFAANNIDDRTIFTNASLSTEGLGEIGNTPALFLPVWRSPSYVRAHRSGVALVITLALLSVLVLILVAFVSMAQLDHTASASYSESMSADQIAHASLNLVVAQLQMEMGKDAPPDTTTGGSFANSPVFTNVTSANIEPQAIVTNSNFPILVKTSTNATPFFTGLQIISQLQASTAMTTTPSQNGRSVSPTRWGQSYFGTGGALFSNAQAPSWVIVTRSGPTNAAGLEFGTASDTINNASSADTNYAIGRFAYAIYNEGNLLDVTAAGSPFAVGSSPALSAAQQDQIKSMLAGADFTVASWNGAVSNSSLTSWRNPAGGSGASTNVYLSQWLVGSSANSAYASTNAAGSVYPGDTTFLSRQDLINAALTGAAGLSVRALPNLTTFTRELNQPSWSPSVTNAPGNGSTGVYPTAINLMPSPAFGPASSQYIANANIVTTGPFSTTTPNPNALVPLIRVPNANSGYTAYHDTGVSYNDPISVGDPVVRRRFSLARLAWLAQAGPATINGTTISAAAIQACFGLAYTTSNDSNIAPGKVWQYVGPTGSTERSSIETLYEVAQENPPREPNFFELLQAGILAGSLGADGGGLSSSDPYYSFAEVAQQFPAFQVLRIGANVICQYNTDQYPRVIEYNANSTGSGPPDPWIAAGIQNLPYLNLFRELGGESRYDPNNTSNPTHYVELHYLFGLWNPHQQNPTTQTTYNRPAIRLCLQTNGGNTIGCASGWATNSAPYTPASSQGPIPITTSPPMYGYSLQLSPGSTDIQLASGTQGHGANGFLNPGLLASADVNTATAHSPNGVNTFTSANGGANSVVTPLPSGWAPLTIGSTSLYTYELPDLQINLATSSAPVNDSLQDYAVPYEGQQFQILLEYNDAANGGTAGNWIPYDYWNGVNDPLTSLTGPGTSLSYCVYIPTQSGASNTPATYSLPSAPSYYFTLPPAWGPPSTYMTCDPRTFRFNPWEFVASMVIPTDSLWSGWASGALPQYTTSGYGGAVGTGYLDYAQQGPSNFVTANYFPASLCRNNSPFSPNNTSASSYPDPDGVQRIADSGLFPASTTSSTGNPFYDPTVNPNVTASGLGPGGQREADRPIILNRPFNHVADLGYAFRDDPWRSLDFFSAYNGASTSADSGLLDLFTVREEPAVVAGRVDLNTQNATVLQSVLSQTVIDVLGNVTGTAYATNNTSAVTAMATQMTNFTSGALAGAGPLVNKDQLVTKLNPTLMAGAFASSVSTSNPTDPQNIKACREAFVRTLADVGQTRTWNLMIDLVAQAGRYPPNANSLDQFVVEGEKRYWLHVAIDRFTGKVIDEKIEPVSE